MVPGGRDRVRWPRAVIVPATNGHGRSRPAEPGAGRLGGWCDGAVAVAGARVLGGRYVLGGVLGTGGVSMVWRARDQVLGREVAVKVLSPQYAADPGFLARFEREARHAAGLSDPHLVTVFDCGVDEAGPFIVMELVWASLSRLPMTQREPVGALRSAGDQPVGRAPCVGR
jgi:hypothetical protein